MLFLLPAERVSALPSAVALHLLLLLTLKLAAPLALSVKLRLLPPAVSVRLKLLTAPLASYKAKIGLTCGCDDTRTSPALVIR